jgi:hypothetical protein
MVNRSAAEKHTPPAQSFHKKPGIIAGKRKPKITAKEK